MSFDGTWQIEDSLSPNEIPKTFHHSVPVPGLANLSTSSFLEVDLFDSRELILNRVHSGQLPESARTNTSRIPRQKRNYFWYRTVFKAAPRKAVAILKINKAQFGTAVWLNGKMTGSFGRCLPLLLQTLNSDARIQAFRFIQS